MHTLLNTEEVPRDDKAPQFCIAHQTRQEASETLQIMAPLVLPLLYPHSYVNSTTLPYVV